MKKYNAEELYKDSGVKGLQNIAGILRFVAYAFLILGAVLALFTMGISFGVGLVVYGSIMVTLPFIAGMKTLVINSVNQTKMMEEMLELAKKQSKKEPESNKEADKQ